MSGNKFLVAAAATVVWAIIGVLLFAVTTWASSFDLVVSGSVFDLTSLLDAWLLVGAILGVADILLLWDMLSGW